MKFYRLNSTAHPKLLSMHPTIYNRIANLKSGNKTPDNKNNAQNPLSILVSDTPYQDSPFDEDYVPRKNKK